MVRVGIAADHGGFALKELMAASLRGSGYEVVDFGAHQLDADDDYPDFIIPLARAVAAGDVKRGVVALWQRRGSIHRREQNSRCACRAHP